MRAHRLRDGQRLAARAIAGGGQHTGLTEVRWDVSGRCLSPRTVEVWGRPDAQERRAGKSSIATIYDVPCRRCEPCRKARAARWRYRAHVEMQGAWRTWFGTLTLSPDRRVFIEAAARAGLARRGTAWSDLDAEEQWQASVAVASAEVTKWLKRIRKESGAKLRFILVVEAHKSGDPHFHVLIHEQQADLQVGERTLRKQWRWGFSKFNLVHETKVARYVTKYLTKSVLARVRASIRYGQYGLTTIDGEDRREKLVPPNPMQISVSGVGLLDYGDCPNA